jgi:hypothetical protein
MPGIARDAVFAWRTLRRRRGFTAIAITTLALGIGMATAIYSVVDGVLFRPLSFPAPSRLMAVRQTYPYWLADPILRRTWDRIPLSIPEYRDWRETRPRSRTSRYGQGGPCSRAAPRSASS